MKFIAGLIIGFLLGTAMPNETRHYAKMLLDGVEKVIQTLKDKLDSENSGGYDEDFSSPFKPDNHPHQNHSNFD